MKKKLRVLCDVDGVCADFANHLIKVVGANFTLDDVQDWDFFHKFSAAEMVEVKKVLKTPDFWAGQPVIPGAFQGVADIRAQGHEIIWVTSPWHSCREWETVRKEWLKKNFNVDGRDVLAFERKELVPGDLLIDDKPANISTWMKAWPHGEGWIFDAPYNRNFHGATRRVTWSMSEERPEMGMMRVFIKG